MTTFLFITLIIILIFWLVQVASLKKKNEQTITKYKTEVATLNDTLQKANTRISVLRKYEAILDAEAEARQIVLKAQQRAVVVVSDASDNAVKIIANAQQDISNTRKEVEVLRVQVLNEIATAKDEAKAIRAEAKAAKEVANKQAALTKEKAEIALKNATVEAVYIVAEAQKIIDNAHNNAKEIAGDAYTAMHRANEWEEIAKAMHNIVDGYGNKYLKPTYSLLDDLAEEFGHTEAGEKLKEARKKTQWMVETKIAAKCDYVEASRKETAINFILDAFNGKTDSALSKVKKDNYGTLEQMIKDAFLLVNNNGKAFRNAVITPDYLSARLDELKWAVVAQELKWQEQEEQRRIKDQIREEEKARRDFEKALKEAAKEEETLKRLIEKAQKEVMFATDAQKAEFERKVSSLEEKLKVAEDKNQRALSMAQQTKSGNIYIISNIGSFGEHVYKIGMTRRLEPLDRIRELGDASVPFEFDVHSLIYTEDAPALERELHKKFVRLQMNKVNPKKEFFKVTLTDIRKEIEDMGMDVKWTMTAEARQYRETLAIEEAMTMDKQLAQEWEKAQDTIDPVSVDDPELAIESV